MNNLKISKHFKLREFECREGKEVKINEELVEKLEMLRGMIGEVLGEEIPLIITSGYRTPEYNEKVGGAPQSQHMRGNAADIQKVDGLTIEKMAHLAERAGFNGIGKYDNFLHADVRGYEARWDERTEKK